MKAITRAPEDSLTDCALTHLERKPIDVARAIAQHADYVEALRSRGVAVEELPPLAGAPDACFVEDTAIVLDEVAVITRPGIESRRREVGSVASALAKHRELITIDAPSTLEGGDVVVAGETLFVGWSKRTNHAGLKELAHRVLRGCLHLKSAMTLIGPETLLIQPEWLDLTHVRGLECLSVAPEEPFGANALRLADSLLHPAGFPRTHSLLCERGFDVSPVEIGEFQKAEGAVTCLSLLLDA